MFSGALHQLLSERDRQGEHCVSPVGMLSGLAVRLCLGQGFIEWVSELSVRPYSGDHGARPDLVIGNQLHTLPGLQTDTYFAKQPRSVDRLTHLRG